MSIFLPLLNVNPLRIALHSEHLLLGRQNLSSRSRCCPTKSVDPQPLRKNSTDGKFNLLLNKFSFIHVSRSSVILRKNELHRRFPIEFTRTLSTSPVFLRNPRLSVGNFSSISTGKSLATGETRKDPIDSTESVAKHSSGQNVAFDPKLPEADEFYAKLSKIAPPTETEIKAAAAGSGKPSLWERFKDMYKKYWYVVLPVHGVLCVGWYGIFYLMALRGFDIMPILERIGVSDTLLNPLRKSGAGYYASAFAMYKVATPLRYSVTLGVSTVTINHLKKLGYIKPMPSTEAMRQFVRETRLQIQSNRKNRKLNIKKDTIRRRLAQLFRRKLTGFGGKSNGKGSSTSMED